MTRLEVINRKAFGSGWAINPKVSKAAISGSATPRRPHHRSR